MMIEYGIGWAKIHNAELIIGHEVLTQEELSWLQYQMWLLTQTSERPELAAKMESIFAALQNDTSAMILTTPEDMK
jgi:hypothetical protein